MSDEKNIPDEKSEDQKSPPAGRAGKSEGVTAASEDSSIQDSTSYIQHVIPSTAMPRRLSRIIILSP
jgi:hypothetical protein